MAKLKAGPARTVRRRASAAAAESTAGDLRYIESSAVVAALLESDLAAREAVGAERCVTSALTLAEAARAIIRARTAGRLSADQEQVAVRALESLRRKWFIVGVTDAVLSRVATRVPVEPIRTLDAIHIATAGMLGEPPPLVTVVTRDARVAENARALGYAVADEPRHP